MTDLTREEYHSEMQTYKLVREAERAARKWARSMGVEFKLAPPEMQNLCRGAFEDGWLAGYTAARGGKP